MHPVGCSAAARARALASLVALGAVIAGCSWLVGVSGDVQLATSDDAATEGASDGSRDVGNGTDGGDDGADGSGDGAYPDGGDAHDDVADASDGGDGTAKNDARD
jgi:hypothetical protein